MTNRTQTAATVGVVEHGNSAFLVTVAARGAGLLDRRRVDLTHGLPTHPYHHEGAWAAGRYLDSPGARPISLPDAVSLIRRVHAAAAVGARASLHALSAAISVPIASIAIRVCPALPATIEERIANNRAQVVADSVMYREALAAEALVRGWTVCWYDRERVFHEAAAVLGCDVASVLDAMGRSVGPPWLAQHKLAAAAAIAAADHATQ